MTNNNCQFEPSTNTSSATICKWCGKEKFQHNTTMSNNRQSSVEWLQFRYNHNINLTEGDFEEAKAMHKEEIIDAYNSGQQIPPFEYAEKFYNKTYGK